MQSQWWISVFFLISFSLYFIAFTRFKRCDQKINVTLWLPLNLIISFGLVALCCAFVNFILPINLLTVAIICFVLAAIFIYLTFKKGPQQYYFKVFDLLVFIAVLLIAVFFGYKQFGTDLMPIYETSDPSVHLQSAIEIIQNQKISSMFYAPLINALCFEFFGVVVTEVAYFKLFILMDIAMLAFAGVTIYSAMSLWVSEIKFKLFAAFLTVAYLLGYPLNNMVFGFVYLGISVTLIVVLIAMAQCYLNDKLNHSFSVFSLMILCFSIGMCYTLFVPPVFFALLIAGIIKFQKEKKLFTLAFVIEQLKIFLLPCILLLLYILASRVGHYVATLAVEGYIYKDLYSNFFLLIPPSVFVVYKAIRKKTANFPAVLFLLLLIVMVGTLILGLKGAFSAYYFYKFYYPMWAVCFYLTFLAIKELSKHNMSFVVTSLVCLTMAFLICISGVDARIQNINIEFNPSSGANKLFEVYQFNSSRIIHDDDTAKKDTWHKKLELYYYVHDNKLCDDDQVMIAANWLDTYWYEGITAQPEIDIYYWVDPALTMQTINDSEYVVVLYDSDMYNQIKSFLTVLKSCLKIQ